MPTDAESSGNNQYIFCYEHGNIGRVITYRNNLIEEIQNDAEKYGISAIQDFRRDISVTDRRFAEFLRLAKDNGYNIYQVVKLTL